MPDPPMMPSTARVMTSPLSYSGNMFDYTATQ